MSKIIDKGLYKSLHIHFIADILNIHCKNANKHNCTNNFMSTEKQATLPFGPIVLYIDYFYQSSQ